MAHFQVCGTPTTYCSGSPTNANMPAGQRDPIKRIHQTAEDAYKCTARYLVSQGYERLPNREFRKEGEPIRVLSKQIRFGGRIRGGKRDKSQQGGKRFMLYDKAMIIG